MSSESGAEARDGYDGLEYLSDEDFDAIGRIVEGAVERQHGQHILDIMADARERRGQGADPLFEVLRQAHQAKADEE
jgi:hypothetical protein